MIHAHDKDKTERASQLAEGNTAKLLQIITSKETPAKYQGSYHITVVKSLEMHMPGEDSKRHAELKLLG